MRKVSSWSKMKILLIVEFFFNNYEEILYRVRKRFNSFLENYVEPSFSYIYPKLKDKVFNSQELQGQVALQFSNYNYIQEFVLQDSIIQRDEIQHNSKQETQEAIK